MNAERKEIILKEISYWKENKLLPEQYCDFLIALYTEGEGIEREKSSNVKQRGNRLLYIDLFILLLLIPFSLIVAYSLDVHWFSKILIYTGMILILLIHAYVFRKKKSILAQIPIIISFLIFLIGSTTLTIFEIGPGIWLNLVVSLNCVLWILTGYFSKQLYLTISGFLGIVILAVVIVI